MGLPFINTFINKFKPLLVKLGYIQVHSLQDTIKL